MLLRSAHATLSHVGTLSIPSVQDTHTGHSAEMTYISAMSHDGLAVCIATMSYDGLVTY